MRYTIHQIRQADCSEIDSAVLGEASTAEEARNLATSIAHRHYYGVATMDNESGMIDFGNEVRDRAQVEITEHPAQSYTWRTDSASGEIEAASPEQAVEKLTAEGEWFDGAEEDGGWLTLFESGVDVLRIGQMP